MIPAYDTRPLVNPTPRWPGFHAVNVRAVWTPTDGDPITVVGDYLDAAEPGAAVELGCGIEELATDLGVERLVFPRGLNYTITICTLVDRQLLQRPVAEVRCPDGTLRITPIPWRLGLRSLPTHEPTTGWEVGPA
ncbi:hypothetical protein [Mycolicibacterium brumae]|uniref:Uncharacterized protein n=1 Tax=Mycolicibacterium brumae TaxID=85968 RepID=A0A2G5P7X9_9MYCO|nr:hypothetical protein [Mycolicibacterium brumae]MCV7194100.1 hypothetical protein [Mycolicibacterium brumae]PIB74415.1 hypothetical protein CQY22_013170 [Mycolicibacterium brumae]RWA22728.1 hypothetical protein MBRU_12320 [Mycolicibacterium brumae DSM 44177]UWW07466.1 hypothetical protein L2Z93_000481 [Mycolicibacterium brumae]